MTGVELGLCQSLQVAEVIVEVLSFSSQTQQIGVGVTVAVVHDEVT